MVYLETGNASEAYRQAYDASKMTPESVNRSAKELIDNRKITARLEELRAPIREKVGITLENHLETLKTLRDKADAAEKYDAAIKAEMARGKVSGLYVDKVEADVTGKVSVVELVRYGKDSTSE